MSLMARIALFAGWTVLVGCSTLRTSSVGTEHAADMARLRPIDDLKKAEACVATARELAREGKDEHALAQFERARAFQPHLDGVAHDLAVLHDRLGHVSAASKAYQQALREKPKDADLHNDYGYFLYGQNDWAAAEKELRQALKLNPKHETAPINLALTLAAQSKDDEAFQQFEQAVGKAAAHHNLGIILTRRGQRDAGLVHLQRAAELDPSLPQPRAVLTHLATAPHDPELSTVQRVSFETEAED